jgi:hypothetical protein
LIRSIGAIFFADIVTTNAVQLLDPVGHFQRHFLAPHAATQDLMNLNMRGFEFELAERYTVSEIEQYAQEMIHSVTVDSPFILPLSEYDEDLVPGVVVLLDLSRRSFPLCLCSLCELLYGQVQSYGKNDEC